MINLKNKINKYSDNDIESNKLTHQNPKASHKLIRMNPETKIKSKQDDNDIKPNKLINQNFKGTQTKLNRKTNEKNTNFQSNKKNLIN